MGKIDASITDYLRRQLGRQPTYLEIADFLVKTGLRYYAEGLKGTASSEQVTVLVLARVRQLIGEWD